MEGHASKTLAGDWFANSDRKIKTSVETVTGALDALDQVRLVSFEYTDEYRAMHPAVEERRYVNVIAQEFAEIFPDAVKGSGEHLPDGSEILQVDTHPLTIYSAAAVQELHAKVQETDRQMQRKDDEIAALRVQNERLAQRLERIESMMAALAANPRSPKQLASDREALP